MADELKISLSLFTEGNEVDIHAIFSSDFLDIHEKELKFLEIISIQGKARRACDHILLEINAQCTALLPCSICNEWTSCPIVLNNVQLSKEVAEIKDNTFDATEMVREAILLEVPQFAECQGSCPERKNMECYCNKRAEKKNPKYFPFEQLK